MEKTINNNREEKKQDSNKNEKHILYIDEYLGKYKFPVAVYTSETVVTDRKNVE